MSDRQDSDDVREETTRRSTGAKESVGLWILEYCPTREKLPYRLTISRAGQNSESFTMLVAERWPVSDQRVFCLREREAPPADEIREEIERVPLIALQRVGPKLTVVLDRPRLRRCDFLFLRRAYKNPTEGKESYEQIFWQTQKAVHTRRPRVRLATSTAGNEGVSVRVSNNERYPWTFPGVETARGPLPCGDYALLEGEEIRAVVERKTFENLLADLGTMDVLHQRLVELESYPQHALVVEAPYEDFVNPKKAHHWGAAFCARAIAELYVRHPRLRIVFLANRKVANGWTRQFFETVGKLGTSDPTEPIGAESEEVLPVRRTRGAASQGLAALLMAEFCPVHVRILSESPACPHRPALPHNDLHGNRQAGPSAAIRR